MPIVIGLTGNIACGKSTVAAILTQHGAQVIDADQVAHLVMKPPGPVFTAIVQEFGPGIVAPDGTIDRRALGRIVFSDSTKLRRLDQLVHPVTSRVIREMIATSVARVVVVEAIKLIEAGTNRICDAVWIVICPREQQIRRLVASRGLTPEDAERRIDAQTPIAEKLHYASAVIDNSGSLEDLHRQVQTAWDALGLK